MDMPFLSSITEGRRREMLAAVAKVLIDKKRKAGEMQEILEQSGLLYEDFEKEFRDLDDVLLSLVHSVSEWVGKPIAATTHQLTSYDEMVDALVEFGQRYSQANATILPGLFRVFLTESSRRAKLKKRFNDGGTAAIARSVSEFLERARSAKIVSAPSSDLVAEALMGLLREPLYDELAIHTKQLSPHLSSVACTPDTVRLFVQGCGGERQR